MVDDKEIKRQIAYKSNIFELKNGVFVKREGWESSYLMTNYGDISRVNVIAVVVSKTDNTLTLDDGTGQISGRMFDNVERLNIINVGDLVLVIARPREFNNEMYLTLEIVKKIDSKWIVYRKKELALIQKVRDINIYKTTKTERVEPEIVESDATIDSKDRIIQLIKRLDAGSGAATDDVITMSKIRNAEDIVNDMIMRGEIFEAKAGYLKIL